MKMIGLSNKDTTYQRGKKVRKFNPTNLLLLLIILSWEISEQASLFFNITQMMLFSANYVFGVNVCGGKNCVEHEMNENFTHAGKCGEKEK